LKEKTFTDNFFFTIEVIARYLGVVLLLILFLLVFGQVFFRFIFGISSYRTFLIAQALLIGVAFINGSVAFLDKEKGHVQIDYLSKKYPPMLKYYAKLSINILMFFITGLIFIGAVLSMIDVWGIARAGVPWLHRGVFYIPVVIGTFFSMIFIIKWTIGIISDYKELKSKKIAKM